jgi:hypothetical protein
LTRRLLFARGLGERAFGSSNSSLVCRCGAFSPRLGLRVISIRDLL